MNEMAGSESAPGRGDRLKALRALARALTGEGAEAKSVWRRMLLGRLASLLLDDQAKLTGAELRSMLETLGTESESAKPGQAGDRLPEAFEKIVHEIYGVNLQRDVKPVADAGAPGISGETIGGTDSEKRVESTSTQGDPIAGGSGFKER